MLAAPALRLDLIIRAVYYKYLISLNFSRSWCFGVFWLWNSVYSSARYYNPVKQRSDSSACRRPLPRRRENIESSQLKLQCPQWCSRVSNADGTNGRWFLVPQQRSSSSSSRESSSSSVLHVSALLSVLRRSCAVVGQRKGFDVSKETMRRICMNKQRADVRWRL